MRPAKMDIAIKGHKGRTNDYVRCAGGVFALAEALISVATLQEFASYSRHKADDNLPCDGKALKVRISPFYEYCG